MHVDVDTATSLASKHHSHNITMSLNSSARSESTDFMSTIVLTHVQLNVRILSSRPQIELTRLHLAQTTLLETCRAQCGASLSSRIVDACTRHNCSLKTLCVMRQSFILVVANLGS